MYVVLEVELYYSSNIIGVFTTLQRANDAAKKLLKHQPNCRRVEVYYSAPNVRNTKGLGKCLVSWNRYCDEITSKTLRRHRAPSINEFAYKLLENDPVALDVLNDVLARGG